MSMKINKVAILMSTYNGEKYIEKQINSIFNQKILKSIYLLEMMGQKTILLI